MTLVRAGVVAQLILMCAALALCPRSALAYQSYTVEEFRSELEACAAAAEDADWERGAENDLPRACDVLENAADIEHDGDVIIADPSYLLPMKKNIERRSCRPSDDCPDPGHVFAGRVRNFADRFEDLATATESGDYNAFHGSMEEILARREFKNPEPWMLRMIPESVKEWFRGLLERLNRAMPEINAPRGLIHVIYALVAVAVVFLIGYILYSVYGESGRRGKVLGDLETPEEENLPPADIRERAEQQARAGNYRDAARLLFLALIRAVEESGIVKFLATKTNREFMAELGRSRTVSNELRALNLMFEDVWYGMKPCSADDYRRFESLYRSCNDELT